MTIDNMSGRLTAIMCAGALGLGGTSLLFGDVIFGAAEFTQKHFQTICIVIGATTAWMAATKAGKSRHVLACLGFVLLALAASGVIVWNSLGRQTEGQMLSADDHEKAVEKRGELTAKKADAEATLASRQREADAECKTGEGPKCRGARVVVQWWADRLDGLQAQLDGLKVKPADASAEAFGNLADAIGRNGTKAKALAMLGMPYLITILFEFGFTMALHYAFRPVVWTVRPPSQSEMLQSSFAAPDSEIPVAQRLLGPDSPGHGPGGLKAPDRPKCPGPESGCMSKLEVLDYVLAELDQGRTIPSQDALVGLSGVRKQRVSEWVREWEAAGLVPARIQRGRCKALAN